MDGLRSNLTANRFCCRVLPVNCIHVFWGISDLFWFLFGGGVAGILQLETVLEKYCVILIKIFKTMFTSSTLDICARTSCLSNYDLLDELVLFLDVLYCGDVRKIHLIQFIIHCTY